MKVKTLGKEERCSKKEKNSDVRGKCRGGDGEGVKKREKETVKVEK